MGRSRRAELCERQGGRFLVVPVVLPDGHLRELRNDGERRTTTDLRHVPVRLRAGSAPCGTAEKFPDPPGPYRGHLGFSGETDQSETMADSERRETGRRWRIPPDAGGSGKLQAVQHV